MADENDARELRGGVPDDAMGDDDFEEEPEVSLTKLIHTNNELIQGLKQKLARAKKRMMEGS